jgi:hypothetical protein
MSAVPEGQLHGSVGESSTARLRRSADELLLEAAMSME